MDQCFFLLFVKRKKIHLKKFSRPSGAIFAEFDRFWTTILVFFLFLARRRRFFWYFSSKERFFLWFSWFWEKNFQNPWIFFRDDEFFFSWNEKFYKIFRFKRKKKTAYRARSRSASCVIDVNEIELFVHFESTSSHLALVNISTF